MANGLKRLKMKLLLLCDFFIITTVSASKILPLYDIIAETGVNLRLKVAGFLVLGSGY
jgi:hypothetical protein